MKTFALIALAGVASNATAQDLVISVVQQANLSDWEISAEFFGSLPAGTTAIGAIWSDASFRVSGDGAVNFGTGWNPGFQSALFGPPAISNDGTNTVTWVGVQAASPLGTPDASNPLFVDDFSYAGSAANLSLELFGQNSALFTGNPAEPFGTILLYRNAQNQPGPLTFRVDIVPVPAPASAALLGLGGLAAARRRR